IMTRVRQRTLAFGVVAFAALGWGGLTAAAIRSTPPTPQIDVTEMQGPEPWQLLSPEDVSAIGYYRRENCPTCHTGDKNLTPELVASKKRTQSWLLEHFKNPAAGAAAANLKPFEATALAKFMTRFTGDNAKAFDQAPQAPVEGAMLYTSNHCNVCHKVNGIGMKTGPALNGVALRRTRSWLEEHFVDPQKMSPGTTMPAYKFSSRDMDRIVSYVLSIP